MSDSILSFLQLRQDAYLDDLRTLVSIDSGSYDRAGVDRINDWLVQRLDSLGFSVQRFPAQGYGDNLLATLEGRGKGRILLLGHSDTVYPAGTAASRPMTIQGNKVLGPGTCDMKAGLLSGLYAVAALEAAGFHDYERIHYLCVSDEEVEDRRSPELIREIGRQADAALTLEAARPNGDIVVARKGVRWVVIEAFGYSAHAGVEPEKGRNAILALAHHIIGLHGLNNYRPGVTVNAGFVKGGNLPNVVPDYAQLKVDLRAFSEEDFEALLAAMEAELQRETVTGVHMRMTQEGPGHPPMPYTEATAALVALVQQEARALGFAVNGAQSGGASDASTVASQGTPVLDGLGPIGGLDHGPDEYIELNSIVPRTALLARLITKIAQR